MTVDSNKVRHRFIPVVIVAAVALIFGAVRGAGHRSAEENAAANLVSAWENNDYVKMYGTLTPSAKARYTFGKFANAYRSAASTATVAKVKRSGEIEKDSNTVSVPLNVTTKAFGSHRDSIQLPVSDGGVEWSPALVFPGLKPGEQLSRTTELPERAAIVARDDTPLADGPYRTSALGSVTSDLVGAIGPIPADRQEELYAAGFPKDAQVGTSGLELTFNAQLAGKPGGTLTAGGRVLASGKAKPGKTLRTSIDPAVQKAATAALAGRYGGIAAIKPSTGEVLALAGIASSAVQPPGSTFKIITVSAALENRLTSLKDTFPVQTSALVGGVELRNAHSESCGGTLIQSFAESCNSVFAPMGAKVGGEKLVAMAEKFGFNRPAPFPGALSSTLPSANEIGDDLAVGSSAIGQGLVQATALQMATIAATIGMRGKQYAPVLLANETGKETQVVSRKTARIVEKLMLAVVNSGTGTAAAIPGGRVAGKTGTAELEATDGPTVDEEKKDEDAPPSTDAWFTAYAPAGKPRIAVAAMFVRAGAGGDVAAPAVREVLLAGLKK